MKKKIFLILFLILFCSIVFLKYLENKYFAVYSISNQEVNYVKAYEKLIPYFLISRASLDNHPIEYIQYKDNQYATMYVVPKLAMEKADVLLSYGVGGDFTFENKFCQSYNKLSLAHDCTIAPFANRPEHPKCKFIQECIGTEKYIMDGLPSTSKIHQFDEVIKRNKLQDKKIFLKVDIAGAEVEVYNQFLEFADNITGIVLVIHPESIDRVVSTQKMLRKIEKDFILVQRHTHPAHARWRNRFIVKYVDGVVSSAMVLTYINKNLVDNYYLALNQHSSAPKWCNYEPEEFPTQILPSSIIPLYFKKNVENIFGK